MPTFLFVEVQKKPKMYRKHGLETNSAILKWTIYQLLFKWR